MGINLLEMMVYVAVLESGLIILFLYLLYRFKFKTWLKTWPELIFWARFLTEVGMPRWDYSKAVPLFRRLARQPIEYWDELIYVLDGKFSHRYQSLVERLAHQEQAMAHLRQQLQGINKQGSQFQNNLVHLEVLQRQIQQDLRNYWVIQSLGFDPDSVTLQRFLSVHVYLNEQETPALLHQLADTTQAFLEILGFEGLPDVPPETGPCFKHWFVRTRATLSQSEFRETLESLRQTLETQTFTTLEGVATPEQDRALRFLVADWQKLKFSAACLLGPVLLMQLKTEDQPGYFVVRLLNQPDMLALEKNPHLLQTPQHILETLAGELEPPQESEKILFS